MQEANLTLAHQQNRFPLRFSPLVTVLISLLLLSPTLTMGFYADDYTHQLVLRGDLPNASMKPWALYDFGTLQSWNKSEPVFSFPWWVDEDWTIRFFRPVASLVMWGQYACFGDWAVGYHLVSLALFAFLLTNAFWLYQQIGLSEESANRAIFLLALCDAIAIPVGWIANQNTLLVAVFSVCSLRLALHPKSSWLPLTIALCLAICSALCKESGATAILLLSISLIAGTPDRTELEMRQRRWFCILSLFAFVVWATALVITRYGTASLFYATPWSDPLRFGSNTLVLFTFGTLGFFGPVPLDLVMVNPFLSIPVSILGVLLSWPLSVWVFRTVRNQPGVPLLVIWTLLFLLPQAGGPPASRLLFVPAIGAMGLLGIFFEKQFGALNENRASSKWQQRLVRAIWFAATIGSGIFILVISFGLTIMSHFLRDHSVKAEVGSPQVGFRDVFILQSENQMQTFTIHPLWAYYANDQEIRLWATHVGGRELSWTRASENSFELATRDAPFLTRMFERVYLSSEPRFKIGDRWKTECFHVEALKVESGLPTHLRFELNKSLDDRTVIFVQSVNGYYQQIKTPAIGATLTLNPPLRAGPYMP